MEWKSILEDAGITVAYFDVSGFEDYLRMLKICTDITGQSDLYDTYGESQKDEVDQIRVRCREKENKRGFIEYLSVKAELPSDTLSGNLRIELRGKNSLFVGLRYIIY